MLENLSSLDYTILAILALIIVIAGLVLIIFLKKSKKTTVLDYAEEKKKDIHKEKKVEVGIQLATTNIPPVENKKPVINNEATLKNTVQNKKKKNESINNVTKNNKNTKEEIKKNEIPASIEEPVIVVDNLKNANKHVERESDKMDEPVIYIENKEEEKKQDNKNKTSIDEILKAMQVDLEKEKYAKIDQYEEEQEQEAVISYQELKNKMQKKEQEAKQKLMQKAMTKVNINDAKPIYEDLPSTPNYSASDFFDILDKNEIEQRAKKEESLYDNYRESIKETYVYEPKKPTAKEIKSTEFISPVFGKQQFTGEYQKIEKPTGIKKQQIRKTEILNSLDETDIFLNTLKEFRNNL